MRLPIRLRLTLAFALSMAALLAGAGSFLYLHLASDLRGSVDTALRAQADVLAAGLGQHGPAFGDTGTEAIQEGAPFAQILDASGRILESSEPVARAPLVPASSLRSVRDPVVVELAVPGVEGTSRLYVLPVTEAEGSAFVVVGMSLNSRQEILSRFVLILVVGGPLALLLASAAGWFIAGAAFRPVERMRREAAAISESDRRRRLPVPGSGDEVARLGATLNSMLDRLQGAFDRERRFVDDASHELRTPLTILKAELDIALSRARTPQEMEAALRSASEEADRMASLADDLLVYSRSDGGRVPVHREDVRLSELLGESAASFWGRAEQSGVRLDVQAPALTVRVDAVRLRQAVDNVIDNALRHTGPGGWIRVVGERHAEQVRVVVEDSGSGFEPDFLSHAFDPFARGARDRAEAAPGAGLGLAIVQAVSQAHGGQATVENRPEGGARVTIVLRAPA